MHCFQGKLVLPACRQNVILFTTTAWANFDNLIEERKVRELKTAWEPHERDPQATGSLQNWDPGDLKGHLQLL